MVANKPLRQRFIQVAGLSALVIFLSLRYGMDPVLAARVSDIRNTKHNLSANADTAYPLKDSTGAVTARAIKASTETQICVFCHTPHAATAGATPLWNRKVAGAGYTPSYILYSSSSLDAAQVQGSLDQPGGSSKLCLSCHDGTVAVGNVNVLNGSAPTPNPVTNSTIATTGGPNMPVGAGTGTGFTRNLGVDLTNDHPISVSYNTALASRDGELRDPSANPTLVGVRTLTNKPKLKLENTGAPGANQAQIQCATCHDPHIREANEATVGNQKFLRLNRFQFKNPPLTAGVFDTTDNTGDIICLACHDKAGSAWAFSAHANPLVADEKYSATHAARREFPPNLPVWQAACLNCHDTHTVSGARRLLREGTNEGVSTAASPKPGGANTAALEETCFQCHDGGANGTLLANTSVPNISADFALARHMPITTATQGTTGGGGGNASEVHDITSSFADSGFIDCTTSGTQCGKDLVEPRSKLGVNNLINRHVECTDCHNPHRVIRANNGLPGALSSANTADALVNGASGGHHTHTDTAGYTHSNAISGVLRGAWGVEPTYGAASFHSLPTGYTVKRGDPGSNTSTLASATYVTREYQICLKCHSDYGYTDNNTYPAGNRPQLNVSSGGTPTTTNGLTIYTNQAKEFQPPSAHATEPADLGTDAGTADANFNAKNHRSWHPVMAPTGRTAALRGVTATSAWRLPWSNAVGTQTMYCTDCHGSNVTSNTSVIPDSGKPFGPHGSTNNFILKGTWDGLSGNSVATTLCLKCHSPTSSSGFSGGGRGNLHQYHADKIGKIQCTWCHIAVPHGWKNRSLLVNLNDVGEEAGQGVGSSKEVSIHASADNYSQEPYYLKAKLKIYSFATSGSWSDTNCGTRNKAAGSRINSSNGNSTNLTSPGTGKDWMTSTCNNPP